MKLVDVIPENIEFDKIDIRIILNGYRDALSFAESLDKLKGDEIDLEVKKTP